MHKELSNIANPAAAGDQCLERPTWTNKDILVGLGLLAFCYLLSVLILHFKPLSYRPWLAIPLMTVVWTSFFIIIGYYAYHVSRERKKWPPVRGLSVSRLMKDMFVGFWILVLISLTLIPIRLLLEVVAGGEIDVMGPWAWTSYAPTGVLIMSVYLIGFTLGPIAEELFFRGFLYNAFKSRMSMPIAIVLQAFIFSVMHGYDIFNTILVFAFGIAIAIVYEKSKDLLMPILIHSMKNAFVFIPLLVLTMQNYHTPAKTWDEARLNPEWLVPSQLTEVESQGSGHKQWEYAINTWGSKGSRQWKKEAKGFLAVCYWFEHDRTACAKAKVGILSIYTYHLRDYKRAVFKANDLLATYPDQREQCARALTATGWAYYMMRDFDKSREAFDTVMDEYQEFDDSYKSAETGIEWLNNV